MHAAGAFIGIHRHSFVAASRAARSQTGMRARCCCNRAACCTTSVQLHVSRCVARTRTTTPPPPPPPPPRPLQQAADLRRILMTPLQAVPGAGHVAPAATAEEQLHRAKAYPYPRPPCSFLLVAGTTYLLPQGITAESLDRLGPLTVIHHGTGAISTLDDVLQQKGLPPLPPAADHHCVLAIGSNAAPEQLARKFPPAEFPHAVIPVLQCVVQSYDVTYSPLISGYGACTASLTRAPGAAVEIFSTYLTAPLLQRMHQTEGGYELRHLDVHMAEGMCLEAYRARRAGLADDAPAAAAAPKRRVQVYVQKHGTLLLPVHGRGTVPILAAEIPGLHRQGLPLTQVQVQAAIRAAVGMQDSSSSSSSSSSTGGGGGDGTGGLGQVPAAAARLRTVDVGGWGGGGCSSGSSSGSGSSPAVLGASAGMTAAAAAVGPPPPPAGAAVPCEALSAAALVVDDEAGTCGGDGDVAGRGTAQAAGSGSGSSSSSSSSSRAPGTGAPRQQASPGDEPVAVHLGGLDAWVLGNVADQGRRRAIYQLLSAAARPFEAPAP